MHPASTLRCRRSRLTRPAARCSAAAAGLPTPGTQLRVVDPESLQDVPDGQQGLILARGPGVMAGYFRDEAATAKVGGHVMGPTWGQDLPAGALKGQRKTGVERMLPAHACSLPPRSVHRRRSSRGTAGLTRETWAGGHLRAWQAAPWPAASSSQVGGVHVRVAGHACCWGVRGVEPVRGQTAASAAPA